MPPVGAEDVPPTSPLATQLHAPDSGMQQPVQIPSKVFVVTRDPALQESAVELLLRAGCATDQARSIADAVQGWTRQRPADWVMVDGRLPAEDIDMLLQRLHEAGARVALLSDGHTPQGARRHPVVSRELEPPWSLDRLLDLIDWMGGTTH